MFSSADTLPDTSGQLFSERKSKDVKTVPGKGRRLGGLHSPRLSLKTEGLHGDSCKTLPLTSEEDILIFIYLLNAV